MNQIPERLKKAIEDDNLVLFIGAGCSMSYGLPSWKDLVVKILTKLDEDFGETSKLNFKNILKQVNDNSNSIFEVLDDIENDHQNGAKYKSESKKIVYDYISSFQLNKESKIHPILWSVSKKIITTNYDQLIEHFKPNDQVKVFDNSNSFQSYKSQLNGAEFLYKIHGDVDNPNTIILFKSDYDAIYNAANFNQNALSSFIKDKTLLFIGFSLADPFINSLLSYIDKVYKGYTEPHYLISTKYEDFTRYNVRLIKVDDWSESLFSMLEEIKSFKKGNSITVLQNDKKEEISLPEDANALIELINKKKETVKINPTKELIAEIEDIQKKLNALLFGDLDFTKQINPEYRNADLRVLFDKIYGQKKIGKDIFDKVQEIKTNKELYKWYERSVIVSALACSLIYNSEVDERKLNLLIDFVLENEDKVWQKAITYLFIVLNHLGNKWVRFQISDRVKSLRQNLVIQEAISSILSLFYAGYYRYSFINNDIFNNQYFLDSFNYFLPFYEENSSINSVYDHYKGPDVNKLVDSIISMKIPDQIKYLICENKLYLNLHKEKDHSNDSFIQNVLKINYIFYPYYIYVQEIFVFFKHFPLSNHEQKLTAQLKINSTSLKDYLLDEKRKCWALAMHFMKEKNWGNAIHNWNGYLKLEQNNLTALYNIANCFSNLDKYDDELDTRLKIAKIDPKDFDNNVDILGLFSNSKKYQNCIDYADKIIDRESKIAEYYYYRSHAFDELHNFNRALEDIEIAISIDNNKDEYYSDRGSIFLELGNVNMALPDLNHAINLSANKKNYNKILSIYYHNRAMVFTILKKYNDAMQDINIAIKLSPKIIKNYLDRSDIKFDMGDIQGALDDLIEVKQMNVNDYSIYNYFANYYRRVNNYSKAFESLEKSNIIEKLNVMSIGTKAAIYSSMNDDDNFYLYAEDAFRNGAYIGWFQDDVKEKYKNAPRFIELLKKYNQKIII